jgi:hypothetical protein
MARVKKQDVVDQPTLNAMIDADVFVRSARERSVADKAYQLAKAALKGWLGARKSRILPDGRTVTLSVEPRAGYTVDPGTCATLTVMPPPAAE